MAETNSIEDWDQLYKKLKEKHDKAYFIIDEAIRLEEESKKEEAFAKYEAGLSLLDSALEIHIEGPSNPDLSWEKACVMVQKMKKTRKEVLCRIADSQRSPAPQALPPPTYEEAMSDSSLNSSIRSLYTYEELGAALQHLKVETNAETAQVLYSHDNVRVYFISPDGSVTATSEPDTLKIVQLNDAGEKTRAYLELGNWIYPLVPDVSPCFRTEYGAFILPDVHSTVEGSAVGIILPEDADASVYDLLDDILHGIATRVPTGEAVMARAGRWKRSGQFSHSISQGLVKGAHYISHGLVKGAVKAGDLMNYGTPRLIQRLTPDPNPTQVSPRVTQGIQVAKNVTGHVVQVTGFLASAIGTATMSLGRFLAPHIQRHGTRLLSSTWNMSESEASEKVDGVFEVAAGAVEGFSTVYEGLECSAAILASNLSNNTVKIVEHKYGHPMAEATGETLHTVGNIFTAANNVKFFTPKGLVKITAKETGKAIVEDYRASLREPMYQNKPNGGGSSSQVD